MDHNKLACFVKKTMDNIGFALMWLFFGVVGIFACWMFGILVFLLWCAFITGTKIPDVPPFWIPVFIGLFFVFICFVLRKLYLWASKHC